MVCYLQCTTAWSRADRSVTLSTSRCSRVLSPLEPVFHVSACSRVLLEQSPAAVLHAPPEQFIHSLARTASRCQRAYTLPLRFLVSSVVLSSACFFLSTPNFGGHWTDLNQTWTHIHLWLSLFWKNWSELPRAFIPNGYGSKNRFLAPTLNFNRTHLCNKT